MSNKGTGQGSTKELPAAVSRFPYTLRIQACEMALDRGLHVIRDNYHLWAIRLSDHVQVWLCSTASYDGLWSAACNLFREPGFDVDQLSYSVGETDDHVLMYDPKAGKKWKIDKDDLRSRRG